LVPGWSAAKKGALVKKAAKTISPGKAEKKRSWLGRAKDAVLAKHALPADAKRKQRPSVTDSLERLGDLVHRFNKQTEHERLIRSESRRHRDDEKDDDKKSKEERDREERERHSEKYKARLASKKEKHTQLRQSFHARKQRVKERRTREQETLKTHVNIKRRPTPKLKAPKPEAY